MYYPYYRGKQFELISIRENAELFARSGFVPIIEPVRESFAGVLRAATELSNASATAAIVINPQHGFHRADHSRIQAMLAEYNENGGTLIPTVVLTNKHGASYATTLLGHYADVDLAIVHAGFPDPSPIKDARQGRTAATYQIFLEEKTSRRYREAFNDPIRVIVKDGFERMRNADYSGSQFFSDLHLEYEQLGMAGFGDFLTVGDHFSEGGGPAYAVAIHLTYINERQGGEMFVQHFVSDDNDTPTDPAGKFGQALAKLIIHLESSESQFFTSTAITEFRALHSRGHFPGLGYIKKLSLNHHLETLAHLQEQAIDA